MVEKTRSFLSDIVFSRKKYKNIISKKTFEELELNIRNQVNSDTSNPIVLIGPERKIVMDIKSKTDEFNRNNITRTVAYLDFYRRNPEIDWAFLAHMVSRNGGWNMTDLKGGLIGELLSEQQKELYFKFLERANALIFHDAFPQLLLYELSKQSNTSKFYLLPAFHVSTFMKPIWEFSLTTNNSALLTISLIINEQNYIENRVIQNPAFRDIFDSLHFKIQELFGLSQILFPFHHKKLHRKEKVRLAGLEVDDFNSVYKRINLGKALYSVLFYHDKVYRGTFRFVNKSHHTGSRSDYWPSIFSSNENDSKFIYSPSHVEAWPDTIHHFDDKSDWYVNSDILKNLESIPILKNPEITKDYARDLIALYSVESVKSIFD